MPGCPPSVDRGTVVIPEVPPRRLLTTDLPAGDYALTDRSHALLGNDPIAVRVLQVLLRPFFQDV